MHNIMTLTEFVRHLKAGGLGYSALYLVPEGKTYTATCKGLVATARRDGLRISTAQMLITDPALLTTTEAIKVTAK